ncbi:MAG: hypothetical protein ACXABY_14165 [Candidatus Thorarchaeota archaeon]|jgi:hypothetical protein
MDKDELASALQPYDFRLGMLEAMGEMLLMLHWMRGLLTWLRDAGLVATVLQPGQMDEFSRVLDKMSTYEDYVWEVLPPRALVQQLRQLRQTGTMDHDIAELLLADSKGRWDPGNVDVQKTMQQHYSELLRGSDE